VARSAESRVTVFIDRDDINLAHGVSTEKWCKRWDLQPFTCPCSNCGAPRTTTIPFFDDQIRGLIAEFCQCGTKDRPYCIVGVGGDLLDPSFIKGVLDRRHARRKRLKRSGQLTGSTGPGRKPRAVLLAARDHVVDPQQRKGMVERVGGRGGSRYAWVIFRAAGLTTREKWPVRGLQKVGISVVRS